jgi:hypothetical protein
MERPILRLTILKLTSRVRVVFAVHHLKTETRASSGAYKLTLSATTLRRI